MNTNAKIMNGQKPFDKYNFALLVCGAPASGKTSFVIDQLTRRKHLDTPEGIFYKKFHKVYIFSPSLNTIQKDLGVPQEQIYPEFDTGIIENIIKEQQEDYKEIDKLNKEIDAFNAELALEALDSKNPTKENKVTKGKKKEHEQHQQILVMFDDMMTEISKDKSKAFMKLIMNRRHIGASIICISQIFNRIPSKIRKGFSDIIIFNTKNRKELECIKDEITSFNPSGFKQLITSTLVEPHDFLLFKTNSNDIYRNLNKLTIEEYSSESE
jgi:GTPase SAR1 family protein